MLQKQSLTSLYRLCGALSGCFLVGVAIAILYDLCGSIFGYIPRASDEFAGYCMAASAFFGLPYTFFHDGHIRVVLLVRHASPQLRRTMSIFVTTTALLLSTFLPGSASKWFGFPGHLARSVKGL